MPLVSVPVSAKPSMSICFRVTASRRVLFPYTTYGPTHEPPSRESKDSPGKAF